MNKEYDEILSDILIQLANIESRFEKADKRMDMTIKRLVKAESRLEYGEERAALLNKSVELLNTKIDQSIKAQQDYNHVQAKLNKHFLDYIRKNK